jgi:hypothetical protein
MGRIRKGVLGGFSGTVGTVIGSNWNGIDYMRSLPTIKKSRTSSQKQLEQQARFAVGVKFVRSMSDLFMETYNKYANRMSGVNTGLSDVLKRAVAGVFPTYSILYDQVFISRGSLPNAASANATAGAGGIVLFSWTNTAAGLGKESPDDQVLLVVHCPAINRSVYRKGALRGTLGDMLLVPAFAGQTVETWITFASADGQDIADSIYTGQVDVLA